MRILGISAYYHDSAAALIVDGSIIAAAQEERFSRKKFDANFPIESIRYCLKKANLNLDDIDEVVYYEKPLLSFERLFETILATTPFSLGLFLKSMPVWLKQKLNTRKTIQNELKTHFFEQKIPPITFSQHHLSHAASAYYPSPFDSAAILCLDGVGEWATTSAWSAHGSHIESLYEIHFPHSLGLLYSAFTSFCGFKVNSGEYKLMGLAPYGQPIYSDLIKQKLIDIKPDGSFRLNMQYFGYLFGATMTNQHFEKLFNTSPRTPETTMPQIYKDLAASIQKVTEEVLVLLAQNLKNTTQHKNLCLAGGVALNCVANAVLVKKNIFENIWIQPAAGDSGGALGAALASYYLRHQKQRIIQQPDQMQNALLGPAFTDGEIKAALNKMNLHYSTLTETGLIEQACLDLQEQKIVGWFQGAMEYGPRALGSRSILGDPRNPQMQQHMNLKIKFRESFRPFAPLVLQENLNNIYEDSTSSPYMLLINHVNQKSRDLYPAVTHVDGSARLQTVTPNSNPLLHKLLVQFEKITGCQQLINTSFNVRGEPIVCSPMEALNCFLNTDIDVVYLNNLRVAKSEQKQSNLKNQHRGAIELD